MLTFEKILKVFEDVLRQDPLYEVVSTSHGHALLGVYSSNLELQFTGGERDDLTEHEEKEIEARCQRLRAKCIAG